MKLLRSALASAALLGIVATTVPLPALADGSSNARIRALQAKLAALQRRYAQQERRIDRLERMFETAFGSSHPRVRVSARRADPPRAATPVAAQTVAQQAAAQQAPAQPVPAQQAGQAQHVAITSPTTGSSPAPQLGAPAPKTESQRAVYQQENAIFNRGLTLSPGIQYSYADNRLFTLNGFLALGAIFLGNIDVTRQQNTVAEPNVTADYSVSGHSEFELTVPWVWRWSTYDAQGAQNSTALVSQQLLSAARIGDLSAGYYYQLPQHTIGGPTIVLNTHLSIPTGSAPYGIKILQATGNTNMSYPSSLPTGTGVYTASVGATIIQTADPAILFGGINVYHNFIRHFDDISPSPILTQPGRVAAGDAAVATLGTAFALNDKISTSFSLQDTIVTSTRVCPDGGPWQTVLGSSLNAAVFNIGTTFSTSPTSYWQAVVGLGMTQDAPNFQVNLRFPQSP